MVKYWGRGLLMLFEPFCKGSARFSNVFFSTPLFIALVSIYDSTLAVNRIIVLGSHKEAFDGLSSFEMYLYPIFASCFLDFLDNINVSYIIVENPPMVIRIFRPIRKCYGCKKRPYLTEQGTTYKTFLW